MRSQEATNRRNEPAGSSHTSQWAALLTNASYDTISAENFAHRSLRADKVSQGDTRPRHPRKTAPLVGNLAPEVHYSCHSESQMSPLGIGRPLFKIALCSRIVFVAFVQPLNVVIPPRPSQLPQTPVSSPPSQQSLPI